MSIRIALANPPEFYTNLDVISGKIILGISRPEQVGAVIVKLEGESKTALGPPDLAQDNQSAPAMPRRPNATAPSQVSHENHKILYKVQQIFPDENVTALSVPVLLRPGQHEWPFTFKFPFNNSCGDPNAMAKIGGLAAAGRLAGPSLFGTGGVRMMDGSKQLSYRHVTKTLPPSFTGFSREAEIRYYIKVTVQRPGLFKENWRHQLGFKFLPIEPPRPAPSNQEAYARRPFTFRPKSAGTIVPSKGQSKSLSVFSRKQSTNRLMVHDSASHSDVDQPPSIEISARLPHPPILTCNKPVPLRLLAKKLVESREECYLVSLQIDLIGSTLVRCEDLINTETRRWVVASRHNLAIPIQHGSDDAVGTETEINDALWKSQPLPNTVMPSFVACNLKRSYALEIKFGISWGKVAGGMTINDLPADNASMYSEVGTRLAKSKGKGKDAMYCLAQTMFLPLHFSSVEVYSGLARPEGLAQAAMNRRRSQPPRERPIPAATTQAAPLLPPRPGRRPSDPLYPPQLRPGQVPGQAQSSGSLAVGPEANSADMGGAAPAYDDAPPSYDDALADGLADPVVPDGQARPAWSGVTNENGPDSVSEKSHR